MPLTAQEQREVAYLSATKDIHFLGGLQGFIENGKNVVNDSAIPCNYSRIINDSGLETQENSTVPTALLAYWDPKAIEMLTAVRSAGKIFPQVKKGSFATPQIYLRTKEVTGSTTAYSDFSNSGDSSVNYNFPFRDNYRMQAMIQMGDLESEMSGEAKIALMADKQKAAAKVIAVETNQIELFGVEGKQIFGILNDPALAPSIAPSPNADNQITWEKKNTKERYGDILALWKNLQTAMGGHVKEDDALTLCMPPSVNADMAEATDFNISVMTMAKAYFTKLRTVIVPELETADGTRTIRLQVDEVDGTPTGECLAPEKFRSYPAFRKESSTSQKVAAATAGAVTYFPVAIAQMEGI